MDDTLAIVCSKFQVQSDILEKFASESEEHSQWLTTLGSYILDNDKKFEDQKAQEQILRKQRLNAEHQLSQLEKQLISCNAKLTKYETNLLNVRTKLMNCEDTISETKTKLEDAKEEKQKYFEENAKLKQKYSQLEGEKLDFSETLDKKNKEIDRLNEEWNEMSKKLAESNKARYEMQYKFDEVQNSDIRKEFKEKRLELERNMLLQQLEQVSSELRTKTDSVNEMQKDKTAKLLSLESKCEEYEQEILQLKLNINTYKDTCNVQAKKIESLMTKVKRTSEERVEIENNMQQELSAQIKLVQLYKEDRDHAKKRLGEVASAVEELQELLKQATEEKANLEGKLHAEEEENRKTVSELQHRLQEQSVELENANDLLQLSKRKGSNVASEDLSILSPMAAQTSKILKKGMTLTQIYSEYVKISDELLNEKDENSRLKHYMEQILQEVEEKAPLLIRQKEDYEHAKQVIHNMSNKMEENIKECQRLKYEQQEYERKVNFHKREEKRLKTLCTDLSQQVRVLLKEVEEARGGVVSSSETLPQLLPNDTSSSGQVISEHLVTFRSIEELQAQNERLLLTVRELSEEQEKLEQEGGSEIIQQLKSKIDAAKSELDALQDNQKVKDHMMEKLCRQRDMYKVLAEKSGVMVGDISSTSALDSQTVVIETELTKARAELDNSVLETSKLKENMAAREKVLSEKIAEQDGELATLKLEHDRLKNKLDFSEEKYSIVVATSNGYKREVAALESKCKSITEALNKIRVEAEKYKQEYHEVKEKLVSAEVNVKTSETEKHLIKEAEKRLMQENQSLLDQQRSQNVLLTNLQTIQNNLERQEFETRTTFSKQADTLQREIRALRRQNDTDMHLLKVTNASLEKEVKEVKERLAIELDKNKNNIGQVESSKGQIETLEAKCKELQAQYEASEKRLHDILKSDNPNKASEDYEHETERYKTKVREMELVLSNTLSEKKAIEDQLEVSKRHLLQYQEIANSNEQAINAVNEKLETQSKEYEKQLVDANEMVASFKRQVAAVVAEKIALKNSLELTEQQLTATINELRNQSAPLERRLQDVTRALVTAKELESAALKESQEQVKIAREASDKYERELVLHARDVEKLTSLKEELQVINSRHGGMEERLSEMKQTLESNEQLMEQMKEHHSKELRKGEMTRKDLIDQNAILHGQVEKLSAQLAAAKSQNTTSQSQESSSDKSVEEVYELLRFVRREKEISETKAEAAETESMRYRQRAEHLQRDLDETKVALEVELERTKGRMLTEDEHQEVMEKVKKAKEYEELCKHLETEKTDNANKIKILTDKTRRLEADLKPLQDAKKTLENEKSSWLGEKTALKAEIDRWTNRATQLINQNVKSDNEDFKKLQASKLQCDKQIIAMQEDLRRTKQQLDAIRRESLKLKGEKNECQSKLQTLQAELTAVQSGNENKGAGAGKIDNELLNTLQKEKEEAKKSLDSMTNELAEKTNIIQQLKKVARKYKSMSDKLQNLLKENSIDFSGVIKNPSSAASADSDQTKQLEDEKNKFESLAEEKTKALEELNTNYNELQTKYINEMEAVSTKIAKFEETQKHYVEAEKKILQLIKENECLKNELNVEKEKQEKNKKTAKTALDRIASLNKLKEVKSKEVDTLTKQNNELQKKLALVSSTSQQVESLTREFQEKIDTLQKQVDELMVEKSDLTAKVEELQSLYEKTHEEKQVSEMLLKASQQKSRSQSTSSSSDTPQVAETPVVLLTATVRPTASSAQGPPSAKFHTQPAATPTASIRPLAHTAPTAMISPTVPATQTSILTTPIASVSALPISVAVHPQAALRLPAEQQQTGRVGTSRPLERAGFKAPVARVTVQAQEPNVDESANVVPNIDDQLEAGSSTWSSDETRSSSSKRSHAHIEDGGQEMEENFGELPEGDYEEPGSKRQRVEIAQEQQQTEGLDSQETLEEEELLGDANEDADDDIMDTANQPAEVPTSVVSRESQLQRERSMQPSPQELLRQRSRGRSQLPSFSLMPGHGGGGFYEETDDSTVPSTPTLFMPKRTDGFAEAVSSPLIRLPTFNFGTAEQTASTPSSAPEETGVTRVDLLASDDLANVPQTPVSVVPSVTTSEHLTIQASLESDTSRDQFFPEDNGQEQNVPQQIDLTEDDEEIEEVEIRREQEHAEGVPENEPVGDEYPAVNVNPDAESDSDSESTSESEVNEYAVHIEELDYGDDDVVQVNAEESVDIEYPEDEAPSSTQRETSGQVISVDDNETGDNVIAVDETSIDEDTHEQSSTSTQEEQTNEAKSEDVDKAKPVRLQRKRVVRQPQQRISGRQKMPAENTEK